MKEEPNEAEIFSQVRHFISEQTRYVAERISPDTDLRRDIGIHGQDAVEFFDAFSERFGVDLIDFDPGEYFEGEGYPDWNWVRRVVGRKAHRELKDMRVRQLVCAVMAGKWVDR